MPRPLTLKQLSFIKYYFECHGNGTEAARQAGYKGNDNTLHSAAVENLRKPTIIEAIERIKQANGLTEDRLLEKHKQLLDQKRPIGATILVDKDGQVIRAEDQGAIEVDDGQVQLGALKLAYEINGKLKKPLIDGSTHYHFISVKEMVDSALVKNRIENRVE